MKSISVPKDAEAVSAYINDLNLADIYFHDKNKVIYELISTEEMEYLFTVGPLREVARVLDKPFLDTYEEEFITDMEEIRKARDIVVKNMKHNKARVLDVLLSQIDNALKYNTGISFEF